MIQALDFVIERKSIDRIIHVYIIYKEQNIIIYYNRCVVESMPITIYDIGIE